MTIRTGMFNKIDGIPVAIAVPHVVSWSPRRPEETVVVMSNGERHTLDVTFREFHLWMGDGWKTGKEPALADMKTPKGELNGKTRRK